MRTIKNMIAGFACAAVVVQPVLAQSALTQSILPDAGANAPGVVITNNGIDMVMINRPNAVGVSVNTYSRFDVAPSGAILNNIPDNYGVTNLGGFVQGNPDVVGNTASLIINEVTASNPSELLGYIEVAGARADVVVANAYGITCDGCGFINTDHVALTTGALRYGASGALDTINVTRGAIEIGAGGADASGVSQFDLIARQVNFAGSVQGQRVLVIAGQNDVIFATGASEARAGDGTQGGEYAIDSTVFGGMYANKITIVSTERGSGVRAPATMSSSAQGMTITSDGRLVLGRAASQGSITARSNDRIVVTEQVVTREALTLEARHAMILEADGMIVSDAAANISAGAELGVGADAQIASRDVLTISVGATLRMAENASLISYRDMGIAAAGAVIEDGALVYVGASDPGIAPVASDLVFTVAGDAAFDSARLYATGSLAFDADAITIEGGIDPAQFASLGNLTVTGSSLTTSAARLEAAGNVSVALEQALTANTGSVIAAGKQLALRSDEVMLAGAVLQAQEDLSLRAGGDMAATDTQIVARDAVTVAADSVDFAGTASSIGGTVAFTAQAGDLALDGAQVGVAGLMATATGDVTVAGTVQSGGALTIAGTGIVATADMLATTGLTITARGALDSSGGLTGGSGLLLDAGTDAMIAGGLQSGGDLTVTAGAALINSAGLLSNGALALTAGSVLDNRGDGLGGANADAATIAFAGNIVRNTGDLTAVGRLVFTGAGNVTTSGDLLAGDTVTLTAGADLRNDGGINAGGVIAFIGQGIATTGAVTGSADVTAQAAADFDNRGFIQSGALLAVTSGGALTNSGNLLASAGITLESDAGLTTSGDVVTGGDLRLTAAGALVQSGTGLNAGQAMARDVMITGGSVDNTGVLTAAGTLRLRSTLGDLGNSAGLMAAGAMEVEAAAADLANSGELRSGGALGLYAGGDLTNAGGVQSGAAIELTAGGALVNTGSGLGVDTADAANLRLAGASVDNAGAFTVAGDINLAARAGRLSNAGALIAGQDIIGTAFGAVDNTADLTAGRDIMLTAGQGLGDAGGLLSGRDLLLTASGGDLANTGLTRVQGVLGISTVGDFSNTLDLISNGGLRIEVTGDLTNGGGFLTGGSFALIAGGDLVNTGNGLAATGASATDITLRGATVTNSGTAAGAGDVTLAATTGVLDNSGSFASTGALSFEAATALSNTGDLRSDGALTLDAGAALANSGGLLTGAALRLTAAGALVNDGHGLGGTAADARTLVIAGANVTNSGAFTVVGLAGLTATAALTNNGVIVSGDALQLAAGTLLRNSASLQTAGDLRLSGADIVNDAALAASGDLTLAASGAVTSSALLQSGAMLTIGAGTSLVSASDLLAQAGIALTAGGPLVSRGGLATAGDVVMTAGGDLTNTGGALIAGQAVARDLTLTGARRVTNAADLTVTRAIDVAAAGLLDNTGTLLAAGTLAMTGGTIDNRAGLTARGGLSLTATAGALATTGALETEGALTLNAAGDLNNAGRIVGVTAITGTAGGALTNSGDFWTDGDLALTAAAALTNSGSGIAPTGASAAGASAAGASAATFALQGASVENTGVAVVAGAVDLVATGGALTNRAALTSGAAMTLQATGALTNDAALASAAALGLAGGSVNNSGALATNAALTVAAQNGGLVNTADLTALSGIDLSATAALSNSGALRSGMDITLAGGSVTNSGGLLATGRVAMTSGGAVVNSGSGLAAGGASMAAFALTGTSVDNAGSFIVQNAVTLLANSGDARLRGTVTSGGNMTVTAAMDATLGGTLRTSGNFTATGATLTSAAAIAAQGTATLRNTSTSGSLQANGAVTVTAAGVLTQSGIMTSAQAGVAITSAGADLNGTITAATGLSVISSGNLSVAGTLTGNQTATLAGRAVAISGTVTGLTGVTLTSAAGDNLTISGLVQSNATVAMTSGATATIAAGGEVKSTANDVTLTARDASIIGSLRAARDVTVNVQQMTVAGSGTIDAGRNARLAATAGGVSIDGDVTAGAAILTASGAVDLSGTMTGRLGVTTSGSFTNSGTVTGTVLAVTAASFDNTATGMLNTTGDQTINIAGNATNRGAMLASGLVTFSADGTLNNYGRIDAGGQLSLLTGTFNNRSGARAEGAVVLATATAQIINAGRLQSAGALVATAATAVTNTGQMQSGGQFTLETASLTNSGRIDAFGGALLIDDLTSLNNTGGILSSDVGVQIGISTALDFNPTRWGAVQSDGWIALQGHSGGYMGALTLGSGEQIVAQGALSIKAASITNAGTIASATDNLTLMSQGGITNTGLIYAGGDWLALRAGGTVTNDGGVILGASNMIICGVATANCASNLSADRAAAIINTDGGVIETIAGDLYLAGGTITNTTGGTNAVTTTGPVQIRYQTIGRDTCRSFLCLGNDSHTYRKERETVTTTTVTVTGSASQIVSGNHLVLNGAAISNYFSLISADANINVQAGTLDNTGADAGVVNTLSIERWYYDDGFLGSNSDSLTSVDPAIITETITASYFGTIEAGGSITGAVTGYLTNGAFTANDASLLGRVSATPGVSGAAQSGTAAGAQGFSGVTGNLHGALGNVSLTTTGTQTVASATAGAGLSGQTLPDTVAALTLAPRGIVGAAVSPVGTTVGTVADAQNLLAGGATLDATISTSTAPAGAGLGTPQIAGGNGPATGAIRTPLRDLAQVSAGSLPALGSIVDPANPARVIGNLNLSPLNNEQLFIINTDPNSNFLIETRPDFISQDSFVGSDYFLETLGFDPDAVQTRLGDPLAETYLIRNQIFNLIGRRIVDPSLSEAEQIRLMYDNAINAADALGLRYGVALSPLQIAALTEDIIWLEERVVSGRTVLVPQVYLAASAGIGGPFAPSQIVAGGDIGLDVGSLSNFRGTITSGGQLIIDAAADISNAFGTIGAAGLVQLTSADGDVVNLSGLITGADVTIVANNISAITDVFRLDDAYGFEDIAGLTAQITATSGLLSLNAVDNITIAAGDLSAVTGLNILAGGTIDFAAIDLGREIDRVGADFTFEQIAQRSTSGSITVSGGDLNINAARFGADGAIIGGGDILFEGTQIAALGVVNIGAYNGNVVFGAGVDTDWSDAFSESGGFLASTVDREEKLSVLFDTTNVSGLAINVFAAGTVLDQSSEFITTNGDFTVQSGSGDVKFQSLTEIDARNSFSQTSILGGLLEFTREEQSLQATALETRARIEGSIDLLVGGDLEFQGGAFTASGDLNTNVAGQTRILGTVDTDFSYVQELNNNSLIVRDTTTVDLNQTADFTRFVIGGAENFDPDSAVRFDLVAQQAALGTAAQSLVGVSDVSDPTQNMALTPFFLPDATGSPDNRLNALAQDPVILALAGVQEAASGDDTGAAGGGDDDGRFDFAGSSVTIGLPGASDDAAFAYIDSLTARDNVTVEEMALIQHAFRDEQVSLGIVGQLILSYVTGQIVGGIGFADTLLGSASQAATTAAVSGVIEGAITGNLDLESLLTDVAFAGVSSFATGAINLDEIAGLGDATAGSLIGAGTNQFSVNTIVNQLGDSVVNAGLTTAVYGGSFGDNFASSFQSGIVNLATADVQNLIGDRFADGANGGEGSLEHVLSHALAGCGSAALQGADCAAGAAAATVAAIGSGIIEDQGASFEEAQAWTDEITLIAGIGAALTGADAEDVMTASGIGGSAFTNNYLTHAQAEAMRDALLNCGPEDTDCLNGIAASYLELSAQNTQELLMCGSNAACIDALAGDIVDARTVFAEISALGASGVFGNDSDFTDTMGEIFGLQNLDDRFAGLQGNPFNQWQDDFPQFRQESCQGLTATNCLLAYGNFRNGRALLEGVTAGAEAVFGSTGIGGAILGVYECGRNATVLGCALAATEVLGGAGELLEAGTRISLRIDGQVVETVADGTGGFRRLDDGIGADRPDLPEGNHWVVDADGNVGIQASDGTFVSDADGISEIVQSAPTRVGPTITDAGRPIEFDGQFYSADGFRFSSSYYDRLWSSGGRPAPFLQARSIMDSSPTITPDPRGAAGYFRYEGAGMEMIYNPTTGQVGHIQPLR